MRPAAIPEVAPGPVSAALAELTGRGALTPDPAQADCARLLDAIAGDLVAQRPQGFLQRLWARPVPVKGAYIFGEVGRGKTMLTDLFFAAVPIKDKRRIHFHEFMDEIHAGIAAFRATPRGKSENADPIAAVVKPILETTRLLVLDEFHVHDIANAMLLYRLFDKLFAGGVVLVATSNVAPDDLYHNGLNRQLFMPFIGLLKRHTHVATLAAATDYRRLKFSGQEVYAVGTGAAARAAMDRLWDRVTGGEPGAPTTLTSIGRTIAVPCAAMGAARFAFADLCERPLGARDFVRLAHAFDTVIIDGVPQFDRTRTDAAKRFILLIDSLYDRGVKFGASFAVPIGQLGKDDKTAFEFARTVSRLIEMGSDDYLVQPHRSVATPA